MRDITAIKTNDLYNTKITTNISEKYLNLLSDDKEKVSYKVHVSDIYTHFWLVGNIKIWMFLTILTTIAILY